MDKTQTTPADFWAKVFLLRYPECMKQMKQRGPEGCAQLSASEADAALAEFTKRFGK